MIRPLDPNDINEYRPDRRDLFPAAVNGLRWVLLDAMRPLLDRLAQRLERITRCGSQT